LQYKRLSDLFFQESKKRISAHGTLLSTVNNLTLKKVCGSPNIYTISNFLTKSELQHLQDKITKGSFQRSFVDQGNGNGKEGDDNPINNDALFDDKHRSSTFLSFQKQEDKKIQAIEQRAADLMGYWSSTSAVEPLQLVRYLPGQHFGVHHDLGEYNSYTGDVSLPPKSFLSHRRLVTIFVYLNKCRNGGETHFPAAGNLRISPIDPGSAILFCNVTEDGKPDPRTIHEGTRVGNGSIKYGLNIWLGEA
jgi:prolyl 4-hydroxylase